MSRYPRPMSRPSCRREGPGDDVRVGHGYGFILFDLELMKVGCPMLQALFGGSRRVCHHVDPKHWFIEPTAKMKLYVVQPGDEDLLIKKLGGMP